MNDHTHKMTDEEWEVNKDCEAKHRDHKWQWKFDIAAGKTSQTHGVCVHCGKEIELNRGETQRGVSP